MTHLTATNKSVVDQLEKMYQLSKRIKGVLGDGSASVQEEAEKGLVQLDDSIKQTRRTAEDQEHELQQLHALADVGYIVNSSLNLTTVLNEVMDTIITLTGAERGFLMLRNREGELVTRIARNMAHETLNENEIKLSRTIVKRVASSGEAVMTTNAQEDPRFDKQRSVMNYHLRSILCVPLKVKETVTGVIYADNRVRTGLFKRRDRNILAAFANHAAVAIENARLFKDLQLSKLAIERAYDATLEGWVHALDLRDKETEGHTRRVTEVTLLLAKSIGMAEEKLVHVRRGALLHDIGKIGIPDHILQKPGPLTSEEIETMRQHPIYAYEMLSPIDYLRPALEIPYCHHEKWDGSGYPRGLKEDKIPLTARIFALADVWDALCFDRRYRRAWPVERVRKHIHKQAGSHFDPQLVEVFLELDLER
jgi:HD-GYP domain-containing protein (c-di-GMP phosphodiesterase class II)